MAYSLRLPDALDAAARTRADYLGISLNALVCVALDAYLRGAAEPQPLADQPAPGENRTPQARPAEPVPGAGRPSKTKIQAIEAHSPPAGEPGKLTRAQRIEFTRRQRLDRKR